MWQVTDYLITADREHFHPHRKWHYIALQCIRRYRRCNGYFYKILYVLSISKKAY